MSNTQPKGTAAIPNPPPQQTIFQMLMGMWGAQAIAAAARLGIADALAQLQPQDSTTLARAVGADVAALARLLRALASLGVLSQPFPCQYALTSVGELLRSDAPGSMRDLLIAETDTPHWQAWGRFDESVRSGQPLVPKLFGMPIFEYYAAHPEDLGFFSRSMGNLSAMVALGTIHNYDFGCAHRIVDVGGANGDFVLAIAQAYSHIHGTVYDLPHVAEEARRAIHMHGYQGRCEALGGDFFQSVPSGGDVYLLKFILHDWKDDDALIILQHCRAVMPTAGKLLVIEIVIPDDNHPSPAQLLDLNMLVMTGGQERTVHEYGSLFAKSGFRLNRIIQTGSPSQILEAVIV